MFARLLLTLVLLIVTVIPFVRAKAVFAHFMVSNAANYSASDWEDDIRLAKDANITAFALNIAYNDSMNNISVGRAFAAAEDKGFQLFFSFDSAANGPWPQAEVISYIGDYAYWGSYYRYTGRPFVSTFEGPDQAEDWISIKKVTACFLVPDWSSYGAKAAMELAGGVADGLFSWAAWPWGPQNMDTYVDASYLQYLNGKPYMMPVSPWFYTNLPEFKKNWLWRGDNLWFDRWQEVLYVQPDWVEIISWNDYGESHYIGPVRQNALGALRSAPLNYVQDMPHDAWRTFLPYSISMYVQNMTYSTKEGIVFWYRPNPAASCGSGQTMGNTASQLQLEFPATEVMADAVFYSALLSSPARVSVSIGGVSQTGSWSDTPDGEIGLYHGNVSFNGRTGPVAVSLSRNGAVFATESGTPITTACTNNLVNWNAWVGSALSTQDVFAIPWLQKDKVCVRGSGANNFDGLCSFACGLGYCPLGACLCKAMGTQKKKPNYTNVEGYPIAGEDASYSGLCAFDCNLGYCPPNACGTVEVPLTVPTVSPFLPPTCISGTGTGNWEGLCRYACNYGMCPSQLCTCTATGVLNVPPPKLRDTVGFALGLGVNDWGLCGFACPRGYCPPSACDQKPANGGSGAPAFIDPAIWTNPAPTPVVGCPPPCVIVLPPYTLPTRTTLSCPPLTKTLTESWVIGTSSTTVTTLTFAPITTDQIPLFNINITLGAVDSATFTVTPSIFCVTAITVGLPPGVSTISGSSSLTYYITSTPPATTKWPEITSSKTVVSFTSTSSATPTCTVSDGCGKVCTKSCSDCGRNGCSCMGCCYNCCSTCNGGGTTNTGEDDPRGCIGLACPTGTTPSEGDNGDGGDNSGGDPSTIRTPSCSSSNTVTHTTVHCGLSAPPGSSTMETSCTSTESSPSVGCSLTATTTTTYTPSGCPKLPAYTPIWSIYTADLPKPGDPNWGGYLLSTGTYEESASTTTTTTGPTAKPQPTPGADGPEWAMYFWKITSGGATSQSFYGYDGGFPRLCLDPPTWMLVGGQTSWVPDSLTGVTVFGDSSCSFAKSDMVLRCSKWAPANCRDSTGTNSTLIGPAGSCIVNEHQVQEYQSIMLCSW
ncbi:glycosyl hydrolase family 71-domain-containing protein [Cercophora scortea]|uniref:Glycosyl hydrolase family 71-domain-containing protein n=1 Tax=Cercophora scortea TaxID=314031 RepID=A0AAE0M417_9PEZI|nr:glycosyl hydrolase family 71-domain-containing protein [Cercophora scortea]